MPAKLKRCVKKVKKKSKKPYAICTAAIKKKMLKEEMEEHPWATKKQAKRIVEDHWEDD